LTSLAFTTQLPRLSSSGDASTLPLREVTIKARQQEKQGDVYKLDGDVEILFQSYVMRAEHVTYNDVSGAVEATGRVVFDGGPHDAHLTAARAIYNIKNETGTFYDVFGTFGAVVRGRSVVLTTSNPFVIVGREVRKVSRNRYIVMNGSITSCAEPTPTWTFNAEKIDLVTGADAKLYHSTFRLMKLPIFYFPYTQAPASGMSRTSGFLLPTVGQSSTKGFIIGDSVYWAINRSADLTVGAEYFSSRGWSQTAQFRARPSQNSSVEFHYFGVHDRGAPVTGQDQGGQDVRLIGEVNGDHWRASANIDYLSSYLFRQAWAETYTQAVDSEVKSVAYFSHNRAGISLNGSAERYQNFFQNQSATVFDQVRILHLPVVEANVLERAISSTPFRWGVDASGAGLQRSEPGFVTADLVGRLDLRPRIALPLQWKGWDLRPELALHETLYTQQVGQSLINPLGVARGTSMNRRDLEAAIELRPPVLEKVFDSKIFGQRLKHVIEPVFTYRFTTGIDRFHEIIRFDATDILTNTSELEYDIIQRLYGRRRNTRRKPECESPSSAPSAASTDRTGRTQTHIPGMSVARPRCEDESNTTRELLTWEVKQKYFYDRSFGGALVQGRRNVFLTTVDLTGIAFLDTPRSWSPVVSKLRVQTSANTDVQWQLDYDSVRGRVNSSAVFLEYRTGEYFFGGSQVYFHQPANSVTVTFSDAPLVFNQFRGLIGYGHPNKRGFSGGFSASFDQNRDFLQYVAAQTSYNSDCCGLSFEYRHIVLPGVRNENQYRFAFTLANIGTFGNMRKQERLY